jgi:hypothetical protein
VAVTLSTFITLSLEQIRNLAFKLNPLSVGDHLVTGLNGYHMLALATEFVALAIASKGSRLLAVDNNLICKAGDRGAWGGVPLA